ncbi:MAG: hypothetical protein ABIK28_16300 [Planctomycetota bacterium]
MRLKKFKKVDGKDGGPGISWGLSAFIPRYEVYCKSVLTRTPENASTDNMHPGSHFFTEVSEELYSPLALSRSSRTSTVDVKPR